MNPELLTDPGALVRLEADWWALFGRSAAATPFQSPAWAIAWWQTFQPGALRVVAVWRGGVLVGLAPLFLEAATARLLPIGIGISDHLDVLVDPACAAEVGTCLVRALDALAGWTELSLEDLGPDADALALPFPADWTEIRTEQGACPTLVLPDSADALDGVIPTGRMRKLRMARHRTARRAGVVEAGTAHTVAGHLETLFDLHAMRWESRGEPGVLADPRVRAFHRAASPGLVRHDLLRSYALRIDGRAAGVFYGLRCRDVAYAYLGGFDPAFGFESPGTVLLAHAIEHAIGEGAKAFSLLRGREPYKYAWGARDRPNTRRLVSRPLRRT